MYRALFLLCLSVLSISALPAYSGKSYYSPPPTTSAPAAPEVTDASPADKPAAPYAVPASTEKKDTYAPLAVKMEKDYKAPTPVETKESEKITPNSDASASTDTGYRTKRNVMIQVGGLPGSGIFGVGIPFFGLGPSPIGFGGGPLPGFATDVINGPLRFWL